MELSKILTALIWLFYFEPTVLFSVTLAIPLLLWTIIDVGNMQKFKGSVKRGIKIWSQPLTPEQLHYFRQLSGSVIEDPGLFWEEPSFIKKEKEQVLISVKNPRNRRNARSEYFGYINLTSPNPVLEFRSSLPSNLLLITIALAYIPVTTVLAVIAFLMGVSIERKAIENFVQQKITV